MQEAQTISTRVWRTILVLIAAATIIVAASLTFTAPAKAAARNAAIACPTIYPAPSWCGGHFNQWRTAYASYKDWGRVRTSDMVCFRAPCGVQSYTAWQLYKNNFYETSLRPGTEVYIWPYGYGYSWVWTDRTGWLVMSTSYLQYRAPSYAYPMAY